MRKDVGGVLAAEDILPNSDSLVVFSARGYLKRMPADTFTAQVPCCFLHALPSGPCGHPVSTAQGMDTGF